MISMQPGSILFFSKNKFFQRFPIIVSKFITKIKQKFKIKKLNLNYINIIISNLNFHFFIFSNFSFFHFFLISNFYLPKTFTHSLHLFKGNITFIFGVQKL
jgi:hypothetical protein